MTHSKAFLPLRYFFKYSLKANKKNKRKKLCSWPTYAQAGQDLFALLCTQFKKKGAYLEIGAHDPIRDSNTFLLEQEYDWMGVSFEIEPDYSYFFNRARKNQCLQTDATQFDYEKYLEQHNFPKQIDYLQIDIDPAAQSLLALKRLPLEKYRFSTITFEHDRYTEGDEIMNESRRIFTFFGYELFAANVHNQGLDVEDWWIDPRIVHPSLVRMAQPYEGMDFQDVIASLINHEKTSH